MTTAELELPEPIDSAEELRRGRTVAPAVLAAFGLGLAFDNVPVPVFGSATNAFVLPLAIAGIWQAAVSHVRKPTLPLMLLTAFAGWGALSMLWTYDPADSLARLPAIVGSLVLVWTGWQLVRERRDLDWLLAGFLAGCAVAALFTWKSFMDGTIYIAAAHVGEGQEEWAERRFAGLGFDPNELGFTLALSVPVVAYLALGRRGWARYLAIPYLPLVLSGIALSGSRGANLTAALAMIFALWWIARRSLAWTGVSLALLALGAFAVWSLTPESYERIFSTSRELSGGTLGQRLPIWRAGLEQFLTHPVTGVGIGGFPNAVERGVGFAIVAHNTPLSVAAELGLPGFLLFFGALAHNVVRAFHAPREQRDLVLALAAIWLLGVLSLTYEYKKETWFVLLVGAAAAALRERGTSERQGAS